MEGERFNWDFRLGIRPLFVIWILSFGFSSAVPGKAPGSTAEVRDFPFSSDYYYDGGNGLLVLFDRTVDRSYTTNVP